MALVNPPWRFDPQDGIADYDDYYNDRVRAQFTIASGASNDDRMMEQALDTEEKSMASRRDVLARQQLRIEEQLQEMERFGDDVYNDDAVLMFKFRHANNSTIYTYVALKVKGLWYLSGASGAKLTWDQLVDFWMRGEVVDMWEATGWEPVT